MGDRRQVRALFISDIHLGTAGCQAAYLLDFLRSHDADQIYLVGDIVDGWQLKRAWYWPKTHNDVILEILERARSGVQVYYIPGNHDEAARQFCGISLDQVKILDHAIHITRDGRRLLVIHGDIFDGVMRHARWLVHLGDRLYTVLLNVNRWFNAVRQSLGKPYWSMSQFLKHKVKNIVSFVTDFEKVLIEEASARGCDGVICGHIHKPEIRHIGNMLYCNDGDWVESLSALVETLGGDLEIIYWRKKS